MRPADQLPPIMLSTDDFQRLANLVSASATSAPEVSEYLADELDRATVLAPFDIAPDVVRMNARVVFVDEKTGQSRTVTLVYPHDADLSKGRISVLTPIGAALLGLSPAQTIEWPSPGGTMETLIVLDVMNPETTGAGDANAVGRE